MVNQNLLKGKIISSGHDLSSFGMVIGVSRSTFHKKINGKIDFKASEIKRICDELKIAPKEAFSIFFAE